MRQPTESHAHGITLAAIGVEDRQVEIELGSAESIKQGVRAGLGAALLWRSSVEPELRPGPTRD